MGSPGDRDMGEAGVARVASLAAIAGRRFRPEPVGFRRSSGRNLRSIYAGRKEQRTGATVTLTPEASPV